MAEEQALALELKTFREHLPRLLANSENKWALVHHDVILGTFWDRRDAIQEGYRQLGNVPFLTKKIERTEIPATI